MKKVLAGIINVLLFSFIIPLNLAPSGAAQGGEVLKFDMPVPVTSSWGVGAQRFGELLAEKTGGKYTLRIYANSQLSGGSQPQALQMFQAGNIDVTLHGSLTWAGTNVRIGAPALPWLFTGWDDAIEKMDGEAGELIFNEVRKSGGRPLAYGISGFRQLFNNIRPVSTPEDLKGLKIRVPGNAMYVDLFKILGADPVPMSASELYTALQQGAVDGQENPADMTITQRFCEVLKYMTVWDYSCETTILSVSNGVWDRLSESERLLFSEAGRQAMKEQIVAARERNDGYMRQLVDEYKIQIIELNAEQIETFRTLAAPIYDQYRDSIGLGLYKALGIK
ncbi:MAG: DctP family TRAP transporter solute-binding subunit [Planctomycetota bacterium]|jgi:tripartite ATP-independent transporter DctP family solute receptor|nr:DctP family TRAP transporter solute-binding subunit [Planctomycetota bacterium]